MAAGPNNTHFPRTKAPEHFRPPSTSPRRHHRPPLPSPPHLTSHGDSPSTRTHSSSLTLDPPLLPSPSHLLLLHGAGHQRPDAGGVRHRRHRVGRLRARAPPRG